MFRKHKKAEKPYLLDGVWCADALLQGQSEPRALTLLWKALMVYCLVAGGIGCLLSAIGVSYQEFTVQVVLLTASMVLAFLYYNHVIENLGYFLIFFLMLSAAYLLRNYINSGFYGILNDLAGAVSEYFESDAMRSYGERISNRPLAITIAVCYIGIVCCLIVNVLVSRRMRYLLVILILAGCLFMPLYLEGEPKLFYVAQFVWGVYMTYVMHRSGHYELAVMDQKYRRSKNRFFYLYSIRTVMQAGVLLEAVVLAVSILLAVLSPKDSFHERHPAGKWKEQTAETVENLSVVGIAGLFNFYDNVGGLTSGRLGGVSAIRLDYETDLTLTFVPTSEERFYLRQFIGGEYLPVANRWEGVPYLSQQTESLVEKAYRKGSADVGQSRIRVDNVAGESGLYLPYYSLDMDKAVWTGRSQMYTYYNTDYIFTGQKGRLKTDWKLEKGQDLYLYVPFEDEEAVDQTIAKAGMEASLSPEENIVRLSRYYDQNIPYSYQPGITPYRKDFVHYFLMENKRGYCAHFASAATLIFRRLGIPARYVEGYAIDPEDIAEEGKVLRDASVDEYHQGYSAMEQTGVVQVDVLDANAHAWVEIWQDGLGWRVVDITPAATGSESQGLWNTFMRLFGSRMNGAVSESVAEPGDAQTDSAESNEMMQSFLRAAAGVLLVLLLLCSLLAGVRLLRSRFRYQRMGRNDKLVYDYQRYIRKMGHDVRGLAERANYEEQIALLYARGKLELQEGEKKRLLSVLEQAGFGQAEICAEDDAWARGKLLSSYDFRIFPRWKRKR